MISEVGQLVLVGTGVLELYSCAARVVLEQGGRGHAKNPSLMSSTVPSRSAQTLDRDSRCSCRRSSPPKLALASLPLRGL
jgi:hypothetical protein